uniref:Uncharacterized protein n=1 Tax=viral metagenome TaxID=1070528 RepID=A0A6C0D7Z0_9ZZZZ
MSSSQIVEEKEIEHEPEKQTIDLQLSDVIRIEAPSNQILNNNTFIIEYIDKKSIKLLNVDDLTSLKLKISQDGILGDGSITSIALIDRNKYDGYARQNNLIPDTWVDIFFGGETPVIITGEITNLEEDMIELKTYPDNDTIYINFGYKGIPEDLPIETITIREKPEKMRTFKETEQEEGTKGKERKEEEEPIQEDRDKDKDENIKDKEKEFSADSIDSDIPIPELDEEIKRENKDDLYNLPLNDIKDTVREFFVRADEIKIGKELGVITQFIDVEESKQRYNIISQTDDLLNELLSNIPNSQRTSSVLNNIHTMIERFKQLRIQFSNLDENGNVLEPIVKSADWKPLATNLLNFKTLLYWLLPVVKNVKKVYNVSSKEDIEDISDVAPLLIDENISDIKNLFDRYKSNDTPSEQNKYYNLISELNPYFTPFGETNIENNYDVIQDIEVANDLNAIVDNLGDFYSSIVENDIVKTRKFVIQRYNLGATRLDVEQMTGKKMVSQRINITAPDTLELKSIITLPEPTIRFSHVNLPGTSIYEKANLNSSFLNYWELLNENTSVNKITIDESDLSLENADITNSSFAKNIKNFVLSRSESTRELSNYEIYKRFLQKVIPKTRILFKLMKKYIHSKLSIHDIVGYLEPFLVYTDDLTFMQWREMGTFLQEKISEYYKNFKEKEKEYSAIKKKASVFNNKPNANKIVSLLINKQVSNEVFLQKYNYDNHDYDASFDLKLTNSEIIWRMITTDFSNIFNNALALANIETMMPENISSIIENIEKQKNNLEQSIKEEEDSEKNKKCVNILIVKQYKTLEEIASDNDKLTYFDKKYDDTMYGILDDYVKEQMSMEPGQFHEFLIQKLISKNKILPQDAPYMAETLITGMKRVVDGQFAIMYDLAQDKILYFKRSNNKWKPDNTVDEKLVSSNQSLLCDFQKDCMAVDKKYKAICESQDLNKKQVTENALKEIVNQFEKKYELSKDTLLSLLNKNYDYNLKIFEKLLEIHHAKTFRYNEQQFKLGISNEDFDKDTKSSPYIKLRDLILGQPNMSKRQNYIVKFAIRFTREANKEESTNDDGLHWRYCIETGVKLLPIFLYTLAVCWTEQPENYLKTIDSIIKDCGKLSDDGDSWVDKYSGYIIRAIDFDIDEGYEEGYKVKTREVMQQDLGDSILNSSSKPVIKKYTTPETKMMSNIVSALAENMGIYIEDQKEFIIKIAYETAQGGVLISEDAHKERVESEAKKGKKVPPYINVYNSTILYLTIGAYLIGIQTAIPSIKTRKTFPGCVRSFTGYPFEGNGDLSSLTYLSCVAYHIRNASHPWSALTKMKESAIADKIKAFIDNYYVTNADVIQKCKDKLEYLIANPEDSIPTDYSLLSWSQFLPPLVPFKLKPITNVSDEFKKECLRNFKTGATCQREKILVIKSKIIFFSLALQERIQKVVNRKKLLLMNSAKEPFLENACCSERGTISTIKYFIEEEPEILLYNKIVRELTNVIEDINAVTKAPLLFCKENSKNIYAPLSDQFNDETIYRSFITFCKFNSIVPIGEELDAICGGKPEHYSKSDSISEKIRKLKQDGKNYNNESLLRLLQFVDRRNIVHLDIDTPIITQTQQMRNIIENMDDDYDIVPKALRQKLESTLDTFDIGVTEDTEEMRDLKNYLARVNNGMKTEIYDFISKNSGATKGSLNNIKVLLNTFMKWGESSEDTQKNSISDESTYNNIQFVKNYVNQFLNIFPETIINKVDFQNAIDLPKYWGLSGTHFMDIKNIINEHYKTLRPFYDDKIIKNILLKIPQMTKNLFELTICSPYMTEIKYKDTKTYSVFDKRTSGLLFENYFLESLIVYKNLSEDKNMLITDSIEDNELNAQTIENMADDELHLASKETPTLMLGNIKDMKIKIAKLLTTYLTIMTNHKDIVDLSYDKIMEVVFKSKEREKDTFTDRLQSMTDEERDADTILKINKLGVWSKGMQKGLTTYVKETYDEERDYMDKMADIETNLRKNKNVVDNNYDQFLEDYMENADNIADIEREENDIGWFNGDDAGEDYFGNEQDAQDYQEYD